MRTLLVIALVLVSGCAALHRAMTTPPPTVDQIHAACVFEDVLSEKGLPVVFVRKAICPYSPTWEGITPTMVDFQASRFAAPFGVLIEREYMFAAVLPDAPQGKRGLLVYYSNGPGADPIYEGLVNAKRMAHFLACSVLPAEQCGGLRNTVARWKEERAYADCRALLFNVDASAQQPERAQACARMVEIVDRNRAMQQAREDRQQALDMQQAQLDVARRAARAAALNDIGNSLQNYKAPPIQMKPFGGTTSTTNCIPVGNGMNCTTTTH
jgi:hypothetical protein